MKKFRMIFCLLGMIIAVSSCSTESEQQSSSLENISSSEDEEINNLYLPDIHEQFRKGTYFHIDLIDYLVEEVGFDKVENLFESTESPNIYITLRNNYVTVPMIKEALPQDIYEQYLKYELHKETMYTMLDQGTYIDIALIEYIGFEEFGAWYETQERNPTLLDVQNHFKIKNEQLKQIVGEEIYALYQEFDYESLGGIRMIQAGETIDGTLIDSIGGGQVFEEWLRESDKQTIYQLVYDFGITEAQLKDTMTPDDLEVFSRFRQSIPSIAKEINTGHYIDFSLVKYIGYEKYKNWSNQITQSEQTVYDLVEFFEITDGTLQEILPTDIYEYYLLYRL